MTTKKYQIFVSSTFKDLTAERQDVIRNILDLKHIPAGMELFPAADIDQLEYIKKVIDECDYYVLIVGGRYGQMDDSGISFTEKEYNYAYDKGKFIIAFIHEDPSGIPVGKSDIDPDVIARLEEFRTKVRNGRLVRGWTDRANLETLVLKSLIHAFNDFPQVGWIRADVAATDVLLQQNNNLLNENISLKAKIEKYESSDIIEIDNLAGLDDEFSIRFTKIIYSRYGTEYIELSIKSSWLNIFKYVATDLDKPKLNSSISFSVRRMIKERGDSSTIHDLNQTDIATIKFQLIALQLLVAEVKPLVGGGQDEFLWLTAKGKGVLLREMVARR